MFKMDAICTEQWCTLSFNQTVEKTENLQEITTLFKISDEF